MQTTLDCLVCFIRQARSTGKLAAADTALQRDLLEAAGQFLATVDLQSSPPVNAITLYAKMAEVLGTSDPFATIKQKSNLCALGLQESMAQQIAAADDPLRAALRVAIGGNIIDYAAQHEFDIDETMASCLSCAFAVDDYPSLRRKIIDAGSKTRTRTKVLYLCDNCGEIVFDGLCIKELQRQGCTVTAAVRHGPIINDATLVDAQAVKLDKICPVITNGTSCPGTPLADCSNEFIDYFSDADIIISKGMGNFETLSEVNAPVFFLFTVKCMAVAHHVTERKNLAPDTLAAKGEMILMEQVCDKP